MMILKPYKIEESMRNNLKPERMRLFGLLIAVLVIVISGCAPKVQILVQSPAEISTKGIKNVAIGSFEVVMLDQTTQIERDGKWQAKQISVSPAQKRQIAKQVRANIVNVLGASSYFSLVYTDEFEGLKNDAALQGLISAEGYKSRQIDGVINGKIWIQMQKTDGSDIDKADMTYVQGGSAQGVDVSVQKLLWWPYKSMRGNLTMEIKLTRLTPTRVVAISTDSRTFSHRVGGAPAGILEKMTSATASLADALESKEGAIENSDAVFPSFEQLISDLSTSIATSLVRRVAVTEKWVEYPIASGGDIQGKLLVEAGAYEMAIERLQEVTKNLKMPADLYNLGLAFEAIGEYGLANTFYTDAWEKDKTNLLYAQGLGRLEKVLRENALISQQLAEKTN